MFLYVMQAGDRIKVGISKAPAKRRYNLNAANPDGVRLVGAAKITSTRPVLAEAQAHLLLKPFHVSGEWFDVEPLYALTVVEFVAADMHDADIVDSVIRLAIHEQRVERRDDAHWPYCNEVRAHLKAKGWSHYERVMWSL